MQNNLITYSFFEKKSEKLIFSKKSQLNLMINNDLFFTKKSVKLDSFNVSTKDSQPNQKMLLTLIAFKITLEIQRKSINDYYCLSHCYQLFKKLNVNSLQFFKFYKIFRSEKEVLLSRLNSTYFLFESDIIKLHSVDEIDLFYLSFKENVVQGSFAIVNQVKEIQ